MIPRMPIEEETRMFWRGESWHRLADYWRNKCKFWRSLGGVALAYALLMSLLNFILVSGPKAKPPPKHEEPEVEIFRYMPQIRTLPVSPTPDPWWTQS